MTTPQKPRVIWIANGDVRAFANDTEPSIYPGKFTKFIEHSAYEELQRELEQVNKLCAEFESDEYDTAQKNKELQSKLALAVEALEKADKTIRYCFLNDLVTETVDVRRLNVGLDAVFMALTKLKGEGT